MATGHGTWQWLLPLAGAVWRVAAEGHIDVASRWCGQYAWCGWGPCAWIAADSRGWRGRGWRHMTGKGEACVAE